MDRNSVMFAPPSVGGFGDWDPTVVVGIDFGMTCTGVAYSSKDFGWARPEVIQQWPESTGALFDKYPSRVAYDRSGRLVDWGICNVSPDIAVKEKEFKLHLDPSFHHFAGGPSHQDAVKFYIDYMKALYRHINQTLADVLPPGSERRIEYRFSIPTTWKSPALTRKQKTWLAEAGFVNTRTCRVVFSRTEAEAAAVYVAESYQEDDVIMIIDAGGATTDLNILKVEEKTSGAVRMRALDKAEGVNIGAVMIDEEARRVVEQKLRAMKTPVERDTDLKWLAEGMMERAGFEHVKHRFGRDDSRLDFYMGVPGRPGKSVVLKSSELRAIFDQLIENLIRVIKEKILSLPGATQATEQLRYLVLSGGLGSSPYLRQRLEEEFRPDSTNHWRFSDLQILVAENPQLAVVKGLVVDRSQALTSGLSAWVGRCSRVSYGVVCRYPYNREKFAGEPTVKDPLTGDLWVEDQIDWLIKEGSVVPEEGLLKDYSLRLAPDQRHETFRIHVVMSDLPAHALPRSRNRGPVSKICTVEGTFRPEDFEVAAADFTPVKSRFYHRGEKRGRSHDVANFRLKVIVGSADIAFEFVSMDGSRTYSQASERVNVVWEDAPAAAALPVNNHSRMFAYPASIFTANTRGGEREGF